jgi:tRNA threonylcarbamoyladenosine biosynthesis protein TsaB
MAIILAVSTATRVCSVALGRDGRCLAEREDRSEHLTHAEVLNVFADEVLREAGLSLQDVDAFAVGIGPGSYTGLRIGLSAAKGWAFALERPVIGIPTLRTLVEAAREQGLPEGVELWPMIDARRMEVFTQPYSRDGEPLAEAAPLVLDAEWVAAGVPGRIVFGDGADKAVELWQGGNAPAHRAGIVPAARAMLGDATERFRAGRFDDLAYLAPEYGKAANVTQARDRSRG